MSFAPMRQVNPRKVPKGYRVVHTSGGATHIQNRKTGALYHPRKKGGGFKHSGIGPSGPKGVSSRRRSGSLLGRAMRWLGGW